MKNFQDILKKLNACSEAREWASDKTIEQVVAECHRGDWLLWLAYRLNVDPRAARAENRMLTADVCRKYIGQEIIELVNKMLQQS